MALINSIACLVLCAGIYIYRYMYPKRKINLLFLLLIISLLPLISLLRAGTYESGDFSINIYKSMAFYQSLREGIIFPQWAGQLNATYGYPLFIFTYPLPYYIISLFHFFHFSFIASLKLLLATSYIGSGIAMYYWIKEESGKTPAFLAAIFYLFAPYHLVDIHFRISIGEIVSFALLPFLFLSITKWMKYGLIKWFYIITLGIFFLLLCNQAISLIAIPITGLYALFLWYEKKRKYNYRLLFCFLAFFFGLLLSFFYWFPVLAETQYTHEAAYSQAVSFVQFSELLFSPWRYGFLFQGPNGQLSFLIGYTQVFVILLALWFLIKRSYDTTQKRKAVIYLSLILILCFLMLPYSNFIWRNIAILRNFQFTYRLLLFVSLFISALAAIVITKINNKWVIYLLCAFAVLQTILNWGNRRTIPQINDAVLRNELPLSTVHGEGLQPAAPIWTNVSNPWEASVPSRHLEIITGSAELKELKRTTTKHEYVIDVLQPSYFRENTLYFPDWTVFANNKVLPINYQNSKYPGVITFTLPKGLYKLDVVFSASPVRIFSEFLSCVTFILLFLSLFQYRRLNRFIRRHA